MIKKKKEIRNTILINGNTSFEIIEAFKSARTNLLFMLNAEQSKTATVFTSYTPMEGKTTICINMGITFAQTGAKVLIIDADLRKPMIHAYLKTDSTPGLSDKLGGLVNDELCIYRTSYDNLFVMPAGTVPPNPTELLISSNMDELLNTLSSLFDYIFIDTPPIGLVTDAAIVGSKCKGVVPIINGSTTRIEHVKNMQYSLKQVDAKLLGCILNNFNQKTNGYKYMQTPYYK